MRRVLFIDDEQTPARYYVRALKMIGRFAVDECRTVDEGFSKLSPRPDAIVLDVMMPSGDLLKDEDTLTGMATGICFLKLVLDRFPEVPVLFLTSVMTDALEGIPKLRNVRCVRKIEYPPFELAWFLQNFLDELE